MNIDNILEFELLYYADCIYVYMHTVLGAYSGQIIQARNPFDFDL